ncbi:MAG: hypothetical protein P1P83_00105 [Bacteroidales bacterium]|nr:hypothetical protein [Bacteroidales bacterium]MDT8372430.1 hypothetical protein [Bacteroidales bacterium]
MKQILIIAALALLSAGATSQTVVKPNYGLKSPATAAISSVEFSELATVVRLSVMSDIENAWFCIDRNTFLEIPGGMRVRLSGLAGLPYCPSTHKFKHPGEKVSFSLTFPATGMLPWFSIVEECSGGCLLFRGIVTDAELNSRLNRAYELTDQGEDKTAYGLFEEIINETDSLDLGIEGSIYTALILIDHRLGRQDAARAWYERMLTSGAPDLGLYLESLRVQGVEF